MMMTDEKLEEIRDTLESDCQESDLVCSIQEAGQTLLAHIDEQAGQIIALKAALIKECDRQRGNERETIKQLVEEYPEISWED